MTSTPFSMPLLTTLAWRNLWRHPRRTIIMLFAITLGIWFMIITAAMTRGIIEQQLRDTIFNLTGHAQIHHERYRDDPAIEHSMPAPTAALQVVLDGPEVEQWSVRVRLPAVVMSERESRGVTLVGIDPEREKGLSFIGNPVIGGRGLESVDDDGVIIGRRMAQKLETAIGKRIVIMAQHRNGEVADRGFRVVGLYATDLEATETVYVFTGMRAAQQLLGMKNEISEIALMTSSREGLEPLVAQLRSAAPELDTRSWKELEPLIVAALRLYDSFMIIWYLIIFVAMGFGLVNTLLMAVFERTRELGLFQALGMRPRFIVGQVMLESLILLVIGIVLGNLSAWFTADVLLAGGIDLSSFARGMEQFSMSSVMYLEIHTKDLVTANGLVVVLGLLASFYPAWKAARYVPVEAITRT